ncbi:hypothetical protein ACFQGT_07895 [Natrialbaceae archaeon GCM10025810]|uniref:hypothetical protein n=1 Tax=Halovalidus salilacus TaxID=3075124 RepID=UPI00361295B4
MSGGVCESCGLEKIGGKCLTRWCDDRHPIVDEVLGELSGRDREVRTDGGTSSSGTEREHHLFLGKRWGEKAQENVEKWGLQDVETLLLAAVEEQGELTQAVLEARDENGDPSRIQDELDDLAALMFQLQWAIDEHSLPKDGGSR